MNTNRLLNPLPTILQQRSIVYNNYSNNSTTSARSRPEFNIQQWAARGRLGKTFLILSSPFSGDSGIDLRYKRLAVKIVKNTRNKHSDKCNQSIFKVLKKFPWQINWQRQKSLKEAFAAAQVCVCELWLIRRNDNCFLFRLWQLCSALPSSAGCGDTSWVSAQAGIPIHCL